MIEKYGFYYFDIFIIYYYDINYISISKCLWFYKIREMILPRSLSIIIIPTITNTMVNNNIIL